MIDLSEMEAVAMKLVFPGKKKINKIENATPFKLI